MATNELDVSVRMTPSTDSGGDGSGDDDSSFQEGTVSLTISDKSNDQSLGGVTVRVTSNDAPYDEEKTGSSYGMATFQGVPVTPLTITLEKTGYDTVTIEATADDWGGSIEHGYN